MKVVQFDSKKTINETGFRCNEKIEPIYFQISTHVLTTLYKCFPFHSLFEGASWDAQPNIYFKSIVTMWADMMMERKLNDMEKAKQAIIRLVSANVIPSFGIYYAAYEERYDAIKLSTYHVYIDYLYSNLEYTSDHDRLISGAKFFEDWLREQKSRYL